MNRNLENVSRLHSAQAALRISPTNNSSLDNLIGSFLGLGRFEEARQIADQLKVANPEGGATQYNEMVFAFLRGDVPAVEAAFEKTRGKPSEPDALSVLVATYFYLGRVKKGEEVSSRVTALYVKDKRLENAAQSLIDLGTSQALFGRCQDAKQNARAALDQSRGRIVLPTAAMVYAVCGDATQAQILLDELMKAYPLDTGSVTIVAPLVRAAMERNRGNFEQALQLLESVRTYDMCFIIGPSNNYERGRIYLDLKKGGEAAREFQRIIDGRGTSVFSPLRSQAYLGLARAYAISGDTAASRKAYQDFFALWKDADPDLSILSDAKKEYEALK